MGIFERQTDELESNSKNKTTRDLYKGIHEFKKSYQPRTNLVKDEWGDPLADAHKILNRWKNYFCHLLNVCEAGGVTQTEMHTAQPFVSEPNASENGVATGRLERYKLPGTDQIPAKTTQTGGETLCFKIQKLIKLICNKENLPHQWSELSCLFIKRVIKLTSNNRNISLLPTSNKILPKILLSSLTPYADEIIGDHRCGFHFNRSTTDQIGYISIWPMLMMLIQWEKT
jgi:hypothetical protein